MKDFLLIKYTKSPILTFQQADAENEQRRRLEQAAQHADHVDPNKAKLAQKKQQVRQTRPYTPTSTDHITVTRYNGELSFV